MLVCNGFVHRGEVTSIIDSLVTPQLMLLMESVEMAGTIGAQVSVCRCEVCVYVYFSVNVKVEGTNTADSSCAFVTHEKTSARAAVACMRVCYTKPSTRRPSTFPSRS